MAEVLMPYFLGFIFGMIAGAIAYKMYCDKKNDSKEM